MTRARTLRRQWARSRALSLTGLPMMLGGAAVDIGDTVTRSARFRASATGYLSRTMSAGGSRTAQTFSLWVKRGLLGTQQKLLSVAGAANDNDAFDIQFTAADKLQITGWATTFRLTTQVFRDVAAHYHIVVAVDSSQAVAGDRIKVYVNGNRVTAFDTNNSNVQNANYGWNFNGAHNIGRDTGGTAYFDGLLSDVTVVSGQSLTPSAFGRTSPTTGAWVHKNYSGSYGTNGFRLLFASISASSDFGVDSSGNSQTFTVTNMSAANDVTNDSSLDTPTNNVCSLNAADWTNTGGTLTWANRRLAYASASLYVGARSTFLFDAATDDVCCEVTITGASATPSQTAVGIAANSFNYETGTNIARNASGTYAYRADGNKTSGTGAGESPAAYGATFTTGDVIGIRLNAGTLTFYKNGVSQGSAYTGLSGTFGFSASIANSTLDFNFGQRTMQYTYGTAKMLTAPLLKLPTIAKPQGFFDINAYTSNAGGSPRTFTGFSFAPDLIWTKSRSAAYANIVVDSIRGVNNALRTETTESEATLGTAGGKVTAFTSDGYTIQTGSTNYSWMNETGQTYVAWLWRKSAVGGLDIVGYAGNGATNRDIAHALGVTPEFIIARDRSATASWRVWHKDLTAGNNLDFSSGAQSAFTDRIGDTINASTFRVAPSAAGNINATGNNYIAYVFAGIAGFSRIGKYTGNGSTDGPFVWCGFRPRFILVKSTATAANWIVLDTARDVYNYATTELQPNASGAELTNNSDLKIDFLSNGFKLRGVRGDINSNGSTYVFAAFAESPFKYANAR